MIYVPKYDSNSCVYIHSSDVIRVYDEKPTSNTRISYTDYYIKSNYISNTGSTSFGNYISIPDCISTSNLTSSYLYRNDFVDILIIISILVIWVLFCLKMMFGRLYNVLFSC